MTDLTNDELRALVERSTPGPWKAKDRTVYHASYGEVAFAQPNDYRGAPEPTAVLIALAPSLAAEVLALREELAARETLRAALEEEAWTELTHTEEEHARLYDEGMFLAALQVETLSGTHWEIDAVSIDDESGDIAQDTGWCLRDYTHWRPMVEPPALSGEPQP